MITYLFYSSISLALLLLVYRFLLEKEKRFTFNRIFLLWSLVFSLTIPLLPVGIAPIETQWHDLFSSGEYIPLANTQQVKSINLNPDFQLSNELNRPSESSSEMPFQITFLIYITVSILLFLRLVRALHELQSKTNRESGYIENGIKIVLLNGQVIPHSFLNTVFVNKKKFERGEIPEEILAHEVAHIKQMHSLDILFVECLKIIFWFNPLLYLYKHLIAQNHEYLADQEVISKGTGIQHYQRMLLKTMEEKTRYSLASSLNFSLTKRRLQMMTQSRTKVKFLLKLVMLAPLFAGLSLMLGCEPASNETSPDVDTSSELSIEILDDNALIVNENSMTLGELERLLSEMPESPELVRMKVSPDAEFGVITDVQSTLRRHEAFKIQYSSQNNNYAEDSTKDSTKISDFYEPHNGLIPSNLRIEAHPEDDRVALIKLILRADSPVLFQLSNNDNTYTIVNKDLPAGNHQVQFDYSNISNADFSFKFKSRNNDDIELNGPFIIDGKLQTIVDTLASPESDKKMSMNSDDVQDLKPLMDMAHKNWQQKWDDYWEIEPIEANLEKLKRAYFIAKEYHKMLGEIQSRYYNAIGEAQPPLPPIPPEPETRIENQ